MRRVLPPESSEPARLHAAMRYAALGDGKRIRPLLMYAAGGAIGVAPEAIDAAAAAVELIHAYSLVHDDLPAMDDDDLGAAARPRTARSTRRPRSSPATHCRCSRSSCLPTRRCRA